MNYTEKWNNIDGRTHGIGEEGDYNPEYVQFLERELDALQTAVRCSLPLTNQKLWDMAKLITDRQRKAKELPTDKVDWNMLEGEWFDWLEEELIGNDSQPAYGHDGNFHEERC